MRLQNFIAGILGLTMCGFAVGQQTAASTANDNSKSTPLILENQEGERRVHRSVGNKMANVPFILKVDPKNGASQHLVMFAEDLLPGASVPVHRHPSSEEIVFLQTGRSRVHLGDTVREVGPGATVFIPSDTWISIDNIGPEPVSLIAIFSEPGFEEYMRAISVREGETNTPMSKAELDAARAQHPHAVSYK